MVSVPALRSSRSRFSVSRSLRREPSSPARAGALRRPDPEPLPVLGRHAQHLGDHDDRQGPGHRPHEIETGRVPDIVKQRSQDAADARFQFIDRLGREQPRVQQSAAMHRVPAAQGRIDRIGILGRARRQRVVTHPALPPLAQQRHACAGCAAACGKGNGQSAGMIHSRRIWPLGCGFRRRQFPFRPRSLPRPAAS